MEKTLADGTVYKKAKFIRTTCKTCRRELSKDLINNGYSWCNKKCKTKWIRNPRPKRKYKVNIRREDMGFGCSDFNNEENLEDKGYVGG